MDDLITWLRATIEGDLAKARAATQGDWAMFGHGDDEYLPTPAYPGENTTRGHGWNISVTDLAGPDVAAELRHADAEHVVAQQPRDTIARCKADLALLDQNAKLHQLADPAKDPRQEYVLAAGASDYALKILAYGYRHRPGWQEGWAP
ncbi:hypothetical protein JOL79_11445 [Microbispora sp. RL4-1S]|uniref:Uncharacterized protein n=1 Tax=Microbispora oryzae TaxID=2806554 RepID=A0A941AJQ2_9ACTN|nr:DUF6221 family protein [Microbispora oryzae]MBP2704428.1 hypothetical protein [Microbispora oryzae]